MRINAILRRNAPSYEPSVCIAEKIIVLPPEGYKDFRNAMRLDQDFIIRDKDLMRVDSEGTVYCLLVLGEGCDDGVLVNSEGADFARYTSFVPGARQLLAAETMRLEIAFMNEAAIIEGVDLRNVFPWLVHIRELAEADAGAGGPTAHFDRCRLLEEFRNAFWQIDQRYEESPAEIFNYKPGYRPEELLPAADWISNGGTADEAHGFAQSGMFQPVRYAADRVIDCWPSVKAGGSLNSTLSEMLDKYGLGADQFSALMEELRGREQIAGLEVDEETCAFSVSFNPYVQEQAAPEPLTQDDLDIIHARHILWCHDQPGGEKADFSGQELRDLCFMRMRFSYASFAGATLENCCLDEGRFFGCDFGDATMVNCTALGGTEFVGAKFANAAITGCSFERAWCMDASFPGTWIERCDFTGASLDGADFSQAELVDCEGLDDIAQSPAMKMGG